MLPPGHIAAGYLTAYSLLRLVGYNFDIQQTNQLLFWGMFFGFVPDMDMFIAFIRVRGFSINANKSDHRKFITHAPLVWLAAGLAVYFLTSSPFTKFIGLMILVGVGSHLFLDTLQYGIMWLWPFSKRLYAFKDRGEKITQPSSEYRGFFSYWLEFARLYMTKVKLSFYFEIAIIITAILVYTHVL